MPLGSHYPNRGSASLFTSCAQGTKNSMTHWAQPAFILASLGELATGTPSTGSSGVCNGHFGITDYNLPQCPVPCRIRYIFFLGVFLEQFMYFLQNKSYRHRQFFMIRAAPSSVINFLCSILCIFFSYLDMAISSNIMPEAKEETLNLCSCLCTHTVPLLRWTFWFNL